MLLLVVVVQSKASSLQQVGDWSSAVQHASTVSFCELIHMDLSRMRFEFALQLFELRSFSNGDTPMAVLKRPQDTKQVLSFFRDTFLEQMYWRCKIVCKYGGEPATEEDGNTAGSDSPEKKWLKQLAVNQARWLYSFFGMDEVMSKLLEFDGKTSGMPNNVSNVDNLQPLIWVERVAPSL
ncbi:unnamed protein product [Amoebophrya sp. A25]|nr:unnamed protein product [Amoebophrya sp. A25]|eukprot:GSA25T00027091001.1